METAIDQVEQERELDIVAISSEIERSLDREIVER